MADTEFFDTGYGGREVPSARVPQGAGAERSPAGYRTAPRRVPQAPPIPVPEPVYAPRAMAEEEPLYIDPIPDPDPYAPQAGHMPPAPTPGQWGTAAHAGAYGYDAGHGDPRHDGDYYDDGYGDAPAYAAAPPHAGHAAPPQAAAFPDYAQNPAPAPGGPSRIGTVLNWAGALVSLGLIVGMGVWGWQLATRDMTDVPVVRALEGPMRDVPLDPGGVTMPNQGLSVNTLAEGAEAAPVPDRITIAPPPMDLQDLGQIRPEPRPDPPEADEAASRTAALVDQMLARLEPLGPVEDAPGIVTFEEGVAPEITVDPPAPALEDATAPAPPPATPQAPAASTIIPASVPGVAVSLRPVPRPRVVARPQAIAEEVTTASASATTGAARGTVAADGVTEIDEATLPSGTWVAQLGALDSPAEAREAWAFYDSRMPGFLDGRPRVIVPVTSGGSQFFRLRVAGFDGFAETRRFCDEVEARGFDCMTASVR